MPEPTQLRPTGIQLRRTAGWRMPPCTIKVDRTSQWGNPYRIGEPVDMKMVHRWGWNFHPQSRGMICKDAEEAVRRFTAVLAMDEAIHPFLREQLGGKNLACWCAMDAPCHRWPLLKIANSPP